MSDTITNDIEAVGGDGAETEMPPGEANAAASTSVLVASLIVVFGIPFSLIAAVFLLISAAMGGKVFRKMFWDARDEKYKGKTYEKVHLYVSPAGKMAIGSAKVTCRLGCVLLVWLLLSTLALRSDLKTATFMGVIHWKWSLLATFLLLAHPIITFTVAIYGDKILKFIITAKPGSQLHYYTRYIGMGLFSILASLLYIASIFLVWMLYFHAQGGLHAGFDKYATNTLVVLLVAALLWILKAAVLLRWQQKAVYEKFRPMILMSAFRLSILCSFFDNRAFNALLPSMYQDVKNETVERDYVKSPFFSKRNAQEYIVSSADVSLDQLKEAADILTLVTERSTSRSTDDAHQLSTILDKYQELIDASFSDTNEATTEVIINKFFSEKRRIILKDVLQAEYPSKNHNEVPLDKWMVDAHKNCLSAAYTLIDAFAMVRVLDTILASCLVMAVIVVWLLVTELASTTVLVVIASPFLALSFVFGDVCKNFFQGFIFAFITHPFDIGDRCIINGNEVEVKRVNIMTTTCLKIGTNEKMVYPNSKLAADLIINLGDKLDPKDVVELVLQPSTEMDNILKMKAHIEEFIHSNEKLVMPEDKDNVVVKEINNGIKIIVHFQHKMDGKDVSYSNFLGKKERQRSALFIEIKKFLEKLRVDVATS